MLAINLTGARLRDEKLSVLYDATTIWPDDFDPGRTNSVNLDADAGPAPQKTQ